MAPVGQTTAHRLHLMQGFSVRGRSYSIHQPINQDTFQLDTTAVFRMQDESVQAHVSETGFHGHDLVAHVPDFSRIPIQVHGPSLVDDHPPDADPVQASKDFSRKVGNLIARVMVFFIGHVASRALKVFPIIGRNNGNDTACQRVNV